MSTYCVCPSKSLKVYKLPTGKKNCWQKTMPISHLYARQTPVLLGENYQMIALTTRFDQNNFFSDFSNTGNHQSMFGYKTNKYQKLLYIFQLYCPLIILKWLNMLTLQEINISFAFYKWLLGEWLVVICYEMVCNNERWLLTKIKHKSEASTRKRVHILCTFFSAKCGFGRTVYF